ncbi:MAG: hypothetical protein ROW48_01795 [Bellilinea sp.]|jgi:hypothetical protein
MKADISKITFEEVWASTAIFYVNEILEDTIDQQVQSLLDLAEETQLTSNPINLPAFRLKIQTNPDILDVILRDIELSEEKFLRLISLLRRLGRVEGGFNPQDSEWNLKKIKNRLQRDENFLAVVSQFLFQGCEDNDLAVYVPRYYLETLNYKEIGANTTAARRVRYKRLLIGTYGGKKGYYIEREIGNLLEKIRLKYGIGFEKGRSRFIGTDIDIAIPTLEDPWVILMSSFQETTSSGQTNKARDMLNVYDTIRRNNNRNRENRIFINFADGGRWLVRKQDLRRLWEECHYFLNLRYLDMLESIVLKHVPETYQNSQVNP